MTTAPPRTLLGTVVRLQVQRSRLKPGERGCRVYDPAPLRQVDELEIGPRGVRGRLDHQPDAATDPVDGWLLDVHHADHPDSRNVKGVNGLSLLPVAHHDALRARYGDHLVDGAAGESLLLDTVGSWPADALAGTLLLETVDGSPLTLTGGMPAPPCVEFSRFCLGLPVGTLGPEVEQALVDLDGGARGYYATATGIGRVRAGARLWRA